MRSFLTILLLLPAVSSADDFTNNAQPLLKKYCYDCHSENKQKGGIQVDHLKTTLDAYQYHRFLENIAHAVEAGTMPPKDDVDDDEIPSDDERKKLIKEIHSAQEKLVHGDFPRNPGRPIVRRLNRNEYNYSVRDLFGVNFFPGREFPADGAGGEGFDNVGDALFVPPVLMEKYLAASKKIIDDIYVKPDLLARLLVAKPSEKVTPQDAAKNVLKYNASLVFRRMATDEDISSMLALAEKNLSEGRPFDESLKAPLQSLLMHPAFLFRSEADQPGKAEWKIDNFELATRLSYFLWSSTPDRQLLKLASEGKLSDNAVLAQQVERLLNDPRSEAVARHFAGQWLGFDEVREVADPDTKRFPSFTPTLRTAMYRESVDFFNHLIRENRPVTDLIDANYTFANEELARHYGIPGVSGTQLQKVVLTDRNRGGVIGQASILVTTSVPLRTSPVKRGKWILDSLLGTPPPPPPPDAGVLPGDDKSPEGLTFRQQLEKHRDQPNCAGCHAKIDPLGFGLENFDAVGRWRSTDANGKPVDSKAELPGGLGFSTPSELKKILLESDELFLRNIARKMLAYSLGRPLEYYDEPVVSDLVKTLRANELKIRPLIQAIVLSHPFQNRSAKR
ncbi:DUF1592 domain-containing protein [Luteolibacter sp. SL250]|uniref:DUF1592 domain-containing protein n=1 Tax=Luteolibacter sp. SL250 TaxID=2995170 RepID=UPI002271B3D6|nr:DUF1592 domain-containing protein [Luteolibacter sp. SL250]WAC21537.1 DUF1592 domain-containing protein [Luteolibacter sp. SL250]